MTTQPKPHDRLTAEARDELPDTAFGTPGTREFPFVDAHHVRAAKPISAMPPTREKRRWRSASQPRPPNTA